MAKNVPRGSWVGTGFTKLLRGQAKGGNDDNDYGGKSGSIQLSSFTARRERRTRERATIRTVYQILHGFKLNGDYHEDWANRAVRIEEEKIDYDKRGN